MSLVVSWFCEVRHPCLAQFLTLISYLIMLSIHFTLICIFPFLNRLINTAPISCNRSFILMIVTDAFIDKEIYKNEIISSNQSASNARARH